MPGITGAPASALGQQGNNAWSYLKGQCTAFAAQMAPWIPAGLGDAADWLHNAQLKGFKTSSTPVAGSVVVYGRGGGYDIANGHVAVVKSVLDATHFTVDEQNFDGRGSIRRGRPSDMRDVSGFILNPAHNGLNFVSGGNGNIDLNPVDAVTGPIGAGFKALGTQLAHIGWVFAGLVLVLLGFALLVVPEVIKKSPVPVPLP